MTTEQVGMDCSCRKPSVNSGYVSILPRDRPTLLPAIPANSECIAPKVRAQSGSAPGVRARLITPVARVDASDELVHLVFFADEPLSPSAVALASAEHPEASSERCATDVCRGRRRFDRILLIAQLLRGRHLDQRRLSLRRRRPGASFGVSAAADASDELCARCRQAPPESLEQGRRRARWM